VQCISCCRRLGRMRSIGAPFILEWQFRVIPGRFECIRNNLVITAFFDQWLKRQGAGCAAYRSSAQFGLRPGDCPLEQGARVLVEGASRIVPIRGRIPHAIWKVHARRLRSPARQAAGSDHLDPICV
jgi:hypothetical protein